MQPVLDAVIDPVIIIDESGSVVSENAAFTDLRHSSGGMDRLTTLDDNPITGVIGAFKPGDPTKVRPVSRCHQWG